MRSISTWVMRVIASAIFAALLLVAPGPAAALGYGHYDIRLLLTPNPQGGMRMGMLNTAFGTQPAPAHALQLRMGVLGGGWGELRSGDACHKRDFEPVICPAPTH